MSAPKHARDIKGRGRYYGSCGDGCPFGDRLFISVTNAQSVVNKPAFPPSAAKITAAAAWERLPQMVKTSRQPPDGPNGCHKARVVDRCGHCRFCINAAIKAEYQQVWEMKRDLGTAIHAAAHAHVLGAPHPYDEEIAPFLEQYLMFLDAWNVDLDRHVEAAETTIVDRRNEYAGTGDVWLHLPITAGGRRQLVLVDIKSSLDKPATTVYADQPLQLAALRYAPKALLNDDTEIDVPKFAATAILNLRPDSHALVPLPTDRDTHKAFLAAATLQRFFHGLDMKAWAPLDAPALPEPQSSKVA